MHINVVSMKSEELEKDMEVDEIATRKTPLISSEKNYIS